MLVCSNASFLTAHAGTKRSQKVAYHASSELIRARAEQPKSRELHSKEREVYKNKLIEIRKSDEWKIKKMENLRAHIAGMKEAKVVASFLRANCSECGVKLIDFLYFTADGRLQNFSKGVVDHVGESKRINIVTIDRAIKNLYRELGLGNFKNNDSFRFDDPYTIFGENDEDSRRKTWEVDPRNTEPIFFDRPLAISKPASGKEHIHKRAADELIRQRLVDPLSRKLGTSERALYKQQLVALRKKDEWIDFQFDLIYEKISTMTEADVLARYARTSRAGKNQGLRIRGGTYLRGDGTIQSDTNGGFREELRRDHKFFRLRNIEAAIKEKYSILGRDGELEKDHPDLSAAVFPEDSKAQAPLFENELRDVTPRPLAEDSENVRLNAVSELMRARQHDPRSRMLGTTERVVHRAQVRSHRKSLEASARRAKLVRNHMSGLRFVKILAQYLKFYKPLKGVADETIGIKFELKGKEIEKPAGYIYTPYYDGEWYLLPDGNIYFQSYRRRDVIHTLETFLLVESKRFLPKHFEEALRGVYNELKQTGSLSSRMVSLDKSKMEDLDDSPVF